MEKIELIDQIITFSNPIYLYKIPYDQKFRSELIKECIKWKNKTEGLASYMVKLHSGWQSEHMLFSTKDPCLNKISKVILSAFSETVKIITSKKILPDYNVHAGGWVNINEKATLHRPHIHNQSTFSGVFYVKLPTPDKESFNDEKKSSFIEFIDPRNSVEGFANNIPEFRNSSPFKPQITIEPKEGNLIIFPSWLMHWVYPNPHSDSRISISFNLMLSKKEDLKV